MSILSWIEHEVGVGTKAVAAVNADFMAMMVKAQAAVAHILPAGASAIEVALAARMATEWKWLTSASYNQIVAYARAAVIDAESEAAKALTGQEKWTAAMVAFEGYLANNVGVSAKVFSVTTLETLLQDAASMLKTFGAPLLAQSLAAYIGPLSGPLAALATQATAKVVSATAQTLDNAAKSVAPATK